MSQHESRKHQTPATNHQLKGKGNSSQKPPTFQLQAQAQTAKKAPQTGSLEKPADLTGLSSLAMHKEAVKMSRAFDQSETMVEKFKLARVLYPIYQELNYRGLEQSNSDQPDQNNEIWQVVGGFGDPMAGMLESCQPYSNCNDWAQAIREYDPRSWDETKIHGAYFGNKTKSGEARATNYGTGIEEARGLIGEEISYIDRKGKKKKRIFSPEIKSGSEWGEKNSEIVKNPNFDLTLDELMEIVNVGRIKKVLAHRKMKRAIQKKKGYPMLPEPPTMEKVTEEMGKFLKQIRSAFRLAQIDTVQGQASYLAHAAGETLFLDLTEGQKEIMESDPDQLSYKSGINGPLDYARTSENAELRKSTRSVDPLGVIETKGAMRGKSQEEAAGIMNQTFIGRGPVQVTHDYNYSKALIYMEELARKAENQKDADELWEAVIQIKKNPGQASNPKYAFLFSAAYMQMSGGLRASGNLGKKLPGLTKGVPMNSGQHAMFDWVSGGLDIPMRKRAGSLTDSVFEAGNRKVETYNKAFEVISRRLGNKPKP